MVARHIMSRAICCYFLPCDQGLEFYISFYVGNQSISTRRHIHRTPPRKPGEKFREQAPYSA